MWLYEKPIAHRGLHNETVPENSMEAFKKAIEHGYYIETDVHLLADNEVVIFHDGNLKRVCGKDVNIKDLTTEDIKSDKYLLPNGENIPLFKDFLELIDGKTKLLLELKFGAISNNHLEEEVYKLIKGKEDSIAVQSFDPFSVYWFKKNAPEFQRGLLATNVKNKILDGFIRMISSLTIRKTKPNFIAFNINYLPSKMVTNLMKKDNNMKLLSWTVKTDNSLSVAKIVPVDNIIFEDIIPEKITDKI